MSRSEDYLDQLLKGVAPEERETPEASQDTLEEDIFNDILEEFTKEESVEPEQSVEEEDTFEEDDLFEEDIFGDDFLDEEFLKEFEMEMEKLEESDESGSEEDVLSLFDDLDNILNGAKEHKEEAEMPVEAEGAADKEQKEETVAVEEDDLTRVDFAELFAETYEPETKEVKEESVEMPAVEEGFSFANLFSDDNPGSTETVPQEDADVLKILEGLDGIDLELDEEGVTTDGGSQDFSALEGFLATSASDSSASSDEVDLDALDFGETVSETVTDEQPAKQDKKTGEKTGFMSKLGLILFGEDEDEEEEDTKNKKKKGKGQGRAKAGEVVIGEASEDELAMLEDITEKSKKEQKKKEQQEKREKAKQAKKEKQEKAKQEKAKKAQAKKEKKAKKPKEPDNTPPLPKKPVFLIFLMVGSLLALIILGADLLGYSNQMTNAKNQYAKKNYSEAFAEISGMEVKEEDMGLYNKYHVMAMVSAELEAYESLMSREFYDMALDCLVRTVGRAEKYRVDAENYGCVTELNELEQKAEKILNETFDLSKEEALEFYAYRSKKEYSTAIAKVIKELGLEKVIE